jgi:hypothetical protein
MKFKNYKNILCPKPLALSAGYIAITSVMIISLLLITITVALSTSNYFSRFNILESEYKTRSLGLAEACVDQALYRLVQKLDTPNNFNVNIGNSQCKIVSISPAGAARTIKTQGEFQKSFSNIKVVANTPGYTVSSWQECKTENDPCQ